MQLLKIDYLSKMNYVDFDTHTHQISNKYEICKWYVHIWNIKMINIRMHLEHLTQLK